MMWNVGLIDDSCAGADGNWARSVPSAPSTLWNESWDDDGNDVGVWWVPEVRCFSRFLLARGVDSFSCLSSMALPARI